MYINVYRHTWFFFLSKLFQLFYLYGCLVCIYICVSLLVCCLWKPEENFVIPDTVLTDSWELPFRCWELKSGLMEEHQMLLTVEPLFLPPGLFFLTLITRLSVYSSTYIVCTSLKIFIMPKLLCRSAEIIQKPFTDICEKFSLMSPDLVCYLYLVFIQGLG